VTTSTDDVLGQYRPMIERMAKGLRRVNASTSWEDCAQEGFIEVWKMLAKGETRQGVILRAAKNRMISQLIHFRDFRHPSVTNFFAMEAHPPTVGEGVGIEDSVWADLEATDNVESVYVAYHEGEIGEAIAALTPNQRKYVFMRFYEGKTHAEIEKAFGYNPGCVWSDKRHGARKRLREELGHLRELVS
jgi:RNA polymerase sigma factor (sigma-70 family)